MVSVDRKSDGTGIVEYPLHEGVVVLLGKTVNLIDGHGVNAYEP